MALVGYVQSNPINQFFRIANIGLLTLECNVDFMSYVTNVVYPLQLPRKS